MQSPDRGLAAWLILMLVVPALAQESFKDLERAFEDAIEDREIAAAVDLIPRLIAAGERDEAVELLLDDGIDSGDARIFDAIAAGLDPLDNASWAKLIARQAGKGNKAERAYLIRLCGQARGEAVDEVTRRVKDALRDKDTGILLAGIAASAALELSDHLSTLRRMVDEDDVLVAEAAQAAVAKLSGEAAPAAEMQNLVPKSFAANRLLVVVDVNEPMDEELTVPAPEPPEGEPTPPPLKMTRLELLAAELRPMLMAMPRGTRFQLARFGRFFKTSSWGKGSRSDVEDALDWLVDGRAERHRDLESAFEKALEDEEVDGLLIVLTGAPNRGEEDYATLRQQLRQLCFQRPLKLCVVAADPGPRSGLEGPDLLRARAERSALHAFFQGLAEDNGGLFHAATVGAPPPSAATLDKPMTAADSVAAGLYTEPIEEFELEVKRGKVTEDGLEALEELLGRANEATGLAALDGLGQHVNDERVAEWLRDTGCVHDNPVYADRCRGLYGQISEERLVEGLARDLSGLREGWHQRALLEGMRGWPQSDMVVGEVEDLAGSRDFAVRLACVDVLRIQGTDDARDALEKMLRKEENLRVLRAVHDAVIALGGTPRDPLPDEKDGPLLRLPVASSKVMFVVDSSAALDESFPDPGTAVPPKEGAPADTGAVPSIAKRTWLHRELGAVLAGWDDDTVAGVIETSKSTRRMSPVDQDEDGQKALTSWLKKLDTADRRDLPKALERALGESGVDRIVIVLAGASSEIGDERIEELCRQAWERGVRIDVVGLFARDGDLEDPDYAQLERDLEVAESIVALEALARRTGGTSNILPPARPGEDEEEE